MGLGSTAKKLQTIADRAEQLYKQLKDIRARVINLEESADETNRQVAGLERDLAEQRALLEAMAAEQGIDVDRVLAEAAIVDAEPATAAGAAAGDDGEDASTTDGDGQSDAGQGGEAGATATGEEDGARGPDDPTTSAE